MSKTVRERALEIYHYNPETCDITTIQGNGNKRTKGHVIDKNTRRLQIDYKQYKKTHIIWLMYYGAWPRMDIDHKDRDDTNDRISNLRKATVQQNMYNSAKPSTSGYRGVCFRKGRIKSPWLAQMRVNGRKVNLGSFPTKEEAYECWKLNAKKHYGEFYNEDVKNPLEQRGDV